MTPPRVEPPSPLPATLPAGTVCRLTGRAIEVAHGRRSLLVFPPDNVPPAPRRYGAEDDPHEFCDECYAVEFNRLQREARPYCPNIVALNGLKKWKLDEAIINNKAERRRQRDDEALCALAAHRSRISARTEGESARPVESSHPRSWPEGSHEDAQDLYSTF